ncbi:carboxypeptidase-like regulatory domain-containing protein [Luteolibacter sp. GHJ8]|uniref:Carboxypeptidase-like regulatory domain-containing protein n=1 Tax=Luteolibacter rhizosphaerae TaxID=2989719 RepID=A0ABT3FXI6_9BACT|nr:carboxypeptidase-like regulatory domain-containing protein [Luteolibacter rhizosphaerae]MCW1911969.1 carboxypeptidase-like regulatory domain-containing protein [Luteolibacter rhizosphaerae]
MNVEPLQSVQAVSRGHGTSWRFVLAVFLAAVAALAALPLIVVNLWVMLMAGMASALDPELFGPNNHPYWRVFWAPPVLALVAVLIAPRYRSRGIVLGMALLPLLLAVVNSLFFFKPTGPVFASGGMVHVVKADGSPAGGAEIWVTSSKEAPTLAGKTEENGSFWLRGVNLKGGERHSILASWRERGMNETQRGLSQEERPVFPVTIRLSEEE